MLLRLRLLHRLQRLQPTKIPHSLTLQPLQPKRHHRLLLLRRRLHCQLRLRYRW
jgi:hypothetical protein